MNALWGYMYEGVNKANVNPLYKEADEKGTIKQRDASKSQY